MLTSAAVWLQASSVFPYDQRQRSRLGWPQPPVQARPGEGLLWVWAWGLCRLPLRAYTVKIAIIIPATCTRRVM